MVALGVIPNRDLMAPPQLAGNAPRLDILQPVVIGLFARFRDDLGHPRPHRLQRGFHDLGGVDEPLVSQHRLDHDLRSVTKGLHDLLVFDVGNVLPVFGIGLGVDGNNLGHHGQPLGVDVGNNQLACLEPVKATVFGGDKVQAVHLGLGRRRSSSNLAGAGHGHLIRRAIGPHLAARVHQPVAGQSVALGHGVIVEIMRAGDLDGTRAKGRVGVFIGNDRDQTVTQGQMHHLANNRLIAFVRGMHRHRAIAEHGFGPGGGDGNVIALFAQGHVSIRVFLNIIIGFAPGEAVFEMPHMARNFGVLDL